MMPPVPLSNIELIQNHDEHLLIEITGLVEVTFSTCDTARRRFSEVARVCVMHITALRGGKDVSVCQTLCDHLPPLSQTLISSALLEGGLLVLIKSLINYLAHQKFSGPLSLHLLQVDHFNLNAAAHTDGSKQTDVEPSSRCVLYNALRQTEFDEAKLEYGGGACWLVRCVPYE